MTVRSVDRPRKPGYSASVTPPEPPIPPGPSLAVPAAVTALLLAMWLGFSIFSPALASPIGAAADAVEHALGLDLNPGKPAKPKTAPTQPTTPAAPKP